MGGVHPTGAQNQVLTAGRCNCSLARQLALAVDTQRVGGVVFGVRRRLVAVEHIVSGVVNQRNAQCRRFFSKHTGRNAIDGKCQLRLAFGQIHRGVRGRIDDQVGPVGPYLCTNLLGFAQVKIVTTQHNQLAQTAEVLLQFEGDLAGLAADQDFQRRSAITHASRSLGSVKPRR